MNWLRTLLFGSLYRSFTPVMFAADGGQSGGSGDGGADNGGGSGAGDDDKRFGQDEVNRIVTERVNRALARFDGVDADEYRKLKDAEAKRRQDEDKRKGDFEKILRETTEEKDSEIKKLRDELRRERVDSRLMRELSEQKAVSPEQGVILLKSNVRVTDSGELEVIDGEGKPRYKGAEPIGVKELVAEFLEKNPHFAAAGPAGSGSRGSGSGRTADVKLEDLDLSNPEDRKRYKERFRKDKALFD